MDIALCIIDKTANQLQFAGAFRPLVHIRNGKLNLIKSDAAPIGGFRGEEPNYHTHQINYLAGDTFFIYTDGYPDQFGGERNKKYMTRRFRELLLSLHALKSQEQKLKLQEELDRWKGARDQVDDILIIGFKL